MKTRREIIKVGAIGAAAVAVGGSAAFAAIVCPPVIPVAEPVPGEMHEFAFHFLVTGDRATARKVMDHFQWFIETSEGWPAKQTGINTSKITRV